jgi:predicted CXXCH cytochrome family protein
MKKIVLLNIIVLATIFVSCESKTYDEISKVTNPKYEANIKPVMDSKCTSCHSPSGTQQPYLTSYAEVKDATQNGVLLCIIDNPSSCFYGNNIMPPSGRMPQTTIDMINLWAINGYLNQ